MVSDKWESTGGDLPEEKAVGSMVDVVPCLGKKWQAAVRLKNAFAYLADVRISLMTASLTLKSEDAAAPPFARTIGKQTLEHLGLVNAAVIDELVHATGLDHDRQMKVAQRLFDRRLVGHDRLHRLATYFVTKTKEGSSE